MTCKTVTSNPIRPVPASRTPSNLLGDSIERAYAAGLHDLPGLLGYLNQAGPTCPGGGPWTEEAYKTLMARLGA